ncbi:hypothetical protein HB779_05895 [Phyllobacterium sp. 628]|uniref:hypothetical protein n=1 Tax=Phyllobacterium sp. 628 TaxID=2718938 RepID=UPI0016625668|nr:hypothetical protein [Phyllobacterium sp. 628]QND51481.1 hypothetical protein HB779_05895 [Phyllobacterium sp. 628]
MLGRIAGALGFSLLMATAPVHAEDKKPVDPRIMKIADELRMAVSRCWLPPAAPKSPPLRVAVKLQLAKDGSIIGQPQVTTPKKSNAYDLLAKSTVQALVRCAPYKVVAENPDLYEDLKEINMNFVSPDN